MQPLADPTKEDVVPVSVANSQLIYDALKSIDVS
jgi:hypothetical protein